MVYERTNTLLTSNRTREAWGKLLGDSVAVAALIASQQIQYRRFICPGDQGRYRRHKMSSSMGKSDKALEKLKIAVNGGQEFLKQSGTLPLEYVTDSVDPPLRDTLKGLCLQIEERHKVHEAESEKGNLFIHYTSIAVLESMLQGLSEKEQKHKERGDNEPEPPLPLCGKKSSFRMYDSVHLNDPDEGNYFVRHLNLPKKYAWLGKTGATHAYIASFIIPNGMKDLSDNLVFWQTYGKEGTGCSLSLTVPRSQLQQVLYGTEQAKSTAKVLRPVLDSLGPLVKSCSPALCRAVREKLARTIWESLERFRYSYKSEIYEHESECRRVVLESNIGNPYEICFEDQDPANYPARIRHYYEDEDLEIKKLLATGSSVTLGPCVPRRYNVRYYLKTLMQRVGLEDVEIKFSKLQYRNS